MRIVGHLSPCLMCVQYCGGAQCSGVFSTVGGIKSTVGISGVPWGCSVPWGAFMINVGDILSTVGDIMSTVEGVHYRGGKSLYPMVLNTPHGTEHPTVLMISPTCIMIGTLRNDNGDGNENARGFLSDTGHAQLSYSQIRLSSSVSTLSHLPFPEYTIYIYYRLYYILSELVPLVSVELHS